MVAHKISTNLATNGQTSLVRYEICILKLFWLPMARYTIHVRQNPASGNFLYLLKTLEVEKQNIALERVAITAKI